MKLTQLFTKTRHNPPADEESKNGKLLIQAGYIHKEMAGVYAYLPLGLRVVEKIKQIVREEMNAIDGQEFIMTNLQRQDLWEKTDRWSDDKVDIWFKTRLQDGDREVGLAWSHEEPITDMIKSHISSYRDLPQSVYQFQTKLRNELRAKSGIMRGREFVMKDLYTYTSSQEEHDELYEAAKQAYVKIYQRLGLGDDTYITYATGGAFTDGYSHEFQTVCDAGEDVIFIDDDKNIAVNEEMIEEGVLEKLELNTDDMRKVKAAEVGNIFSFGTEKTSKLGLHFTNSDGQQQPVYLGSYGVGVTRVMGVIVEKFADERGLVWPEQVAPFMVHVVSHEQATEQADALYRQLTSAGVDVLLDDRDESFGAKMKDADLLGMPYRVVVSPRSLDAGGFEFKPRVAESSEILSAEELLQKFS